MSYEENILNLCENTIKTIKNILNYNLNKEISIQLNQKLFLLETAIDGFKSSQVSIKDNQINFKESKINFKESYLEENEHHLKKSVEAFEKDIIRDAIAKHGSKRKAATALNVEHSTLIKKCQRYGI